MTRDQYANLLMPALLKVADRCVENESKHQEGLTFDPEYAIKCISHAVAATRGKEDFGSLTSHWTGAAYNALMMLLSEEYPEVPDYKVFIALRPKE